LAFTFLTTIIISLIPKGVNVHVYVTKDGNIMAALAQEYVKLKRQAHT